MNFVSMGDSKLLVTARLARVLALYELGFAPPAIGIVLRLMPEVPDIKTPPTGLKEMRERVLGLVFGRFGRLVNADVS